MQVTASYCIPVVVIVVERLLRDRWMTHGLSWLILVMCVFQEPVRWSVWIRSLVSGGNWWKGFSIRSASCLTVETSTTPTGEGASPLLQSRSIHKWLMNQFKRIRMNHSKESLSAFWINILLSDCGMFIWQRVVKYGHSQKRFIVISDFKLEITT